MSSASSHDRFLGRKDIVLFASSVISSLFPAPPLSLKRRLRVSPFPDWLSYVLYRTMLPDTAVMHALDLLQRLAGEFQCSTPTVASYEEGDDSSDDWDPSTAPELLHHRLMTSTLILVTRYWMDDAYSSKSWSTATRGYFTVREISEMEMSMLAALDFCILDRQHGQTADALLAHWDAQYASWKEEQYAQREQQKVRFSETVALNHALKAVKPLHCGHAIARPVSGAAGYNHHTVLVST